LAICGRNFFLDSKLYLGLHFSRQTPGLGSKGIIQKHITCDNFHVIAALELSRAFSRELSPLGRKLEGWVWDVERREHRPEAVRKRQR
jgi:hypothetical protein